MSDPIQRPLPPERGWHPDDFPVLTVDLIPHSSSSRVRADPMLTVNENGWLLIESGNVRLALPDRVEWGKLSYMVECLWNAHQGALAAALYESQGEDDGSIATSRREGESPHHDQPDACSELAGAQEGESQSG